MTSQNIWTRVVGNVLINISPSYILQGPGVKKVNWASRWSYLTTEGGGGGGAGERAKTNILVNS